MTCYQLLAAVWLLTASFVQAEVIRLDFDGEFFTDPPQLGSVQMYIDTDEWMWPYRDEKKYAIANGFTYDTGSWGGWELIRDHQVGDIYPRSWDGSRLFETTVTNWQGQRYIVEHTVGLGGLYGFEMHDGVACSLGYLQNVHWYIPYDNSIILAGINECRSRNRQVGISLLPDLGFLISDIQVTRDWPVSDVNYDGSVDAADAGIMFGEWGTPQYLSKWVGDINHDFIIDAADAGILFGQWTGDAAPVPEPGSAWILILVLILTRIGLPGCPRTSADGLG